MNTDNREILLLEPDNREILLLGSALNTSTRQDPQLAAQLPEMLARSECNWNSEYIYRQGQTFHDASICLHL